MDLTWLRAATREDGTEPASAELRAVMAADAVHIRGHFAEPALLRALRAELEATSREPWSQHDRCDDAAGPAVRFVFEVLSRGFGVEVLETRVNAYAEGQWKPFHQDRNAHCPGAGNFTAGASFGAARILAFTSLGRRRPLFCFEQRSGDVFAFGDRVNAALHHGILPGPGPRWSLVVWGWRRALGPPRIPEPVPPFVPDFARTRAAPLTAGSGRW